jgi:hypothetical protein
MEKLGGFLGWVTGICFGIAILNFVVKRVNKKWISKLPTDSKVKQIYQKLMKIIVKYHRYFGMGAGVIVLVHLYVQVSFAFVSVTGLLAAVQLIATAVMGALMLYGHQNRLLGLHRYTAAAGVFCLFLHLILKL